MKNLEINKFKEILEKNLKNLDFKTLKRISEKVLLKPILTLNVVLFGAIIGTSIESVRVKASIKDTYMPQYEEYTENIPLKVDIKDAPMSIEEDYEFLKDVQNNKETKLDSHAMLIVSKYFDGINDYINLEKSNKEYNGIIEQFHFNPIPLKNEKEREIFKNVETYHHYDFEKNTNYNAENDLRNKKHVYWDIDYTTFKNKKIRVC